MVTAQECLNYARDCVQLAGLTKNDVELRDHFLELAREWMVIAEHEEKVPKLNRRSNNRASVAMPYLDRQH